MTSAQEKLYWREWGFLTKRCKAAAMPLPDRHELHEQALGGPKSHKLFTNPDFDKVLGVFRSFSQPENMNAQLRQMEQPTTRLHYKIGNVLKCLALYPKEAPMGYAGALAYAREILRDKRSSGSRFTVAEIEDLSDAPRGYQDSDGDLRELPSEVMQLVYDLSRCLNKFRAASGDTIHTMKLKAGVKCTCATWCKPRPKGRVLVPREVAAVLESNEPF